MRVELGVDRLAQPVGRAVSDRRDDPDAVFLDAMAERKHLASKRFEDGRDSI
jgi:hypothetical protein